MALSKSRRFEIFKRDAFTCQYCGQRPPEVVLEVDHIEPSSLGGADDELNLITSCWDCNRGKGAKRLGDVHPRPDADLAFLEAQQELAEARRYIQVKQARDEAYGQVIDELNRVVMASFHWGGLPSDDHWRSLLVEFGPDEIEDAIRIVGPRYRAGLLKDTSLAGVFRYMRGVMRNRREQ